MEYLLSDLFTSIDTASICQLIAESDIVISFDCGYDDSIVTFVLEIGIDDRSTCRYISTCYGRFIDGYIGGFRYLSFTVEFFCWIRYRLTEDRILRCDGRLESDGIETSIFELCLYDLLTESGIIFGECIAVDCCLIDFLYLSDTYRLILISEGIAELAGDGFVSSFVRKLYLIDILLAAHTTIPITDMIAYCFGL
jgi:hypothetical protein